MNALDAAVAVLGEAGCPLHYREITNRMLFKGIWTTRGKTPWATVNAQLSVEIADKGRESRFVRTGPGMYALRSDRSRDQGITPVVSFVKAAEKVLRQSGNFEPLHYKVITERALEQRLIRTGGRTPSATMNAVIGNDVRTREAKGETPIFVQHGSGMVGLATWLPTGVAGRIEQNNRDVRKRLLERVSMATPSSFEALVGELLVAMGFEDVEVTKVTNDGGVDVRGTLVVAETIRIRMAVQAKRWKNNVQAPTVQQVRGSLGAHEQGLIIATSDFSTGARNEATRHDAAPVALMNGEQLAVLLANHEIGTHIQSYDLLTLDEDTVPD